VSDAATLTKKDFQSDQDVRWCPGCGDYAILSAVQSVFPELGIPKEKLVVISGIGCSSPFPYYMDTYGFHSIHGRAPAIATGLKVSRPDLNVWVVTGDGDALSIGGNHLIHVLRRNVDLTILLFNNRIYGLTKGQYSPTSEEGKRTKSTPYGSIDHPFNPLAVALGAGASFVARSVDIFQSHLKATLQRAAEHKGTSLVEIYQNCNIFNDKAFEYMTDKSGRVENTLYLEHGKPMVWGDEDKRGIRLDGLTPEIVKVGEGGVSADDCLVWDESRDDPSLAFLAAHLVPPEMPTPIGVFRAVERPTYDEGVVAQVEAEVAKAGTPKLEDLLAEGDTWTVAADGTVS
jgi:2-oxoglutarate ferredoxin oxidoreductase subunit beta